MVVAVTTRRERGGRVTKLSGIQESSSIKCFVRAFNADGRGGPATGERREGVGPFIDHGAHEAGRWARS